MSWLSRGREQTAEHLRIAAAAAAAGAASYDSPAALAKSLRYSVHFINARSGTLPLAAVANARKLTDTLGEIIETSSVRPLDVYTTVAVASTLNDYLPTTLKGYLAVDPALRDTARGDGRTPTQSLMSQLEALYRSAEASLVATRNQDADALMTQGRFLETKFAGSDLDL
ncbi:hypothetical protein [Cellulomonas sp. URHD0024]|uniref:hypothetical protein n=1 Tax=Cellulomonas sp. URHD0024 TaxID=1302620 RepID=UPI0004226152|nr:hypothetical protein [Cellulomonas sp. URHD0024]